MYALKFLNHQRRVNARRSTGSRPINEASAGMKARLGIIDVADSSEEIGATNYRIFLQVVCGMYEE